MRSKQAFYYYLIGGIAVLFLLLIILISLLIEAFPALITYGIELFYLYYPAIYGSIIVSIIALLIATVLALGSSIFIVEYVPRKLKGLFINLNDLMASFPTIVFGFWGLYELGPFLNSTLFNFFHVYFGFLPIFSTTPTTASYLLASTVLAIMITPFASSLIREVYSRVPESIDEGIYALGLGKYHAIKIKVSYITKSIFGALTLAYGRGLGETVAVALTVGNSFIASPSLLSPGITIPALIANQFGSAFTQLELSSLFALALLLFIIGLVFIITGKILFYKKL